MPLLCTKNIVNSVEKNSKRCFLFDSQLKILTLKINFQPLASSINAQEDHASKRVTI